MLRPSVVIEDCPQELDALLTASFTQDKIQKKDTTAGELSRGLFQKENWGETAVDINADGQVTFPEKILSSESYSPVDTKTYYDDAQQDAVGSAISALLPAMESIFDRSLRGMQHKMVIGVQVLFCCGTPQSGGWHQDGPQEQYPLTSIVYFNHADVVYSKFSLRKEYDNVSPLLCSFETPYTMVSFNNQSLQHRVHDIVAINESEPSHRYLLTIFYVGPHHDTWNAWKDLSSLRTARLGQPLSTEDKRSEPKNTYATLSQALRKTIETGSARLNGRASDERTIVRPTTLLNKSNPESKKLGTSLSVFTGLFFVTGLLAAVAAIGLLHRKGFFGQRGMAMGGHDFSEHVIGMELR